MYAHEFEYHPSGTLKKYKSGNGVVTTINHSAERLWTEDIRVDVIGAQPDLFLDYGYDEVGNIKWILDGRGASANQHFQYDELDRLKRAGPAPNEPSGPYGVIDYSYDAHSNQSIDGQSRVFHPDTLRLTSQE